MIKEQHRDPAGNAHFYTSQAKHADKAIREKRAENADPQKPLYVLALVTFPRVDLQLYQAMGAA